MEIENLFIGIFILFIFIVLMLEPNKNCKYEYVDLEGNTGIADRCINSRGGTICYSGDETIQVSRFKIIKKEVER